MKALRLIVSVLIAAVAIPIVGGVLQESAIAFRNGHPFGWLISLLHSFDFFPLALMAAPLHAIGTTIVAALSLGLERLLTRRSFWIWVAHGAGMGAIQLLWLVGHSGRSPLVTFGTLGSWLLAATGMWLMLSRRQPFHGRSS